MVHISINWRIDDSCSGDVDESRAGVVGFANRGGILLPPVEPFRGKPVQRQWRNRIPTRLSEPMTALESLRRLIVIDEVQRHPALFH
ncbi:MAG TPA: hypothetical protein VKJ65_00245, partial [Phycisphaerae bacterium]|nr:hypothetical protein [Phycisphaerae bacterium]